MVAFLTSSFVPYRRENFSGKTPLINENGFADRLREHWKSPARFLVVASDPEDAAKTDAVARQMETTFSDAGFPIEEVQTLDRRTAGKAAELVQRCFAGHELVSVAEKLIEHEIVRRGKGRTLLRGERALLRPMYGMAAVASDLVLIAVLPNAVCLLCDHIKNSHMITSVFILIPTAVCRPFPLGRRGCAYRISRSTCRCRSVRTGSHTTS